MDDVSKIDNENKLMIVKTTKHVNKKDIIKIIGKILIIILFVAGTIYVANTHEHWSDEAQSFLLARDNSLFELFDYMKYEGTPPLWVLVLKLFIFLGGTYDTLFILPIIFSTIGLIIFEFKVKAPWYIKILLPFTYFIFYQNSIIARSYCMIFPMLMILAVMYEKRFEKPILYAIILLFLMNISLHTLVIAGSFYLIFLIENWKNKKFKDKKIVIACVLIFMELLIACLCTIPAPDCAFVPKHGEDIFHVILEATIGSNSHELFEIIMSIIIAEILIFTLKKHQVINFFILIMPVTAILIFITFQGWHVGIIWLVIITHFIINDMLDKNKVIKIFVAIVCLVQITWTISSIKYDINNNYSASKEVAQFLKENNYQDKKIYGFGYGVTGIQPYFESNIFDNIKTGKAFQIWADNANYSTIEELINIDADVYIIPEFYCAQYGTLMRQLYLNGYNRRVFEGYTYIKDHKYETEGFFVYTKENL